MQGGRRWRRTVTRPGCGVAVGGAVDVVRTRRGLVLMLRQQTIVLRRKLAAYGVTAKSLPTMASDSPTIEETESRAT